MPETYYVGSVDENGTIIAVAGPFEKAIEASNARAELVGEDQKYTLPLIVHRPPRPILMVTLPELQTWYARRQQALNRRAR